MSECKCETKTKKKSNLHTIFSVSFFLSIIYVFGPKVWNVPPRERERENGTRHMTYIKIIVNETTKHDYYGDDDNDNDNGDDDDDDS